MAFFHEKLFGFIRRHPLRMHFDPDEVTTIAQERVDQLRQAISRIVVMEPFVQNHLFAVMRPTFGVRTGARELARLG